MIATELLPHLAGWEGRTAKYPWSFGPYGERANLIHSLPDRVWQLLLCEFAESVYPIWAARFPDDLRLRVAIDARLFWCRGGTLTAGAAYAAGTTCAALAACAARAADAAQWAWMEAVFNSAKPVPWSGDWRTSDAVGLAETYWSSRDSGVLPILADALQDAGCDNEVVLARLRSEIGPHSRADVAIWQTLGVNVDTLEESPK